jgi:hypothetical protein
VGVHFVALHHAAFAQHGVQNLIYTATQLAAAETLHIEHCEQNADEGKDEKKKAFAVRLELLKGMLYPVYRHFEQQGHNAHHRADDEAGHDEKIAVADAVLAPVGYFME